MNEKDRKTRCGEQKDFVGSSTLLVSWRRREAVVCFVSRDGSRATGCFGVLETHKKKSRIINVRRKGSKENNAMNTESTSTLG
jgi:hypothetical protein